MWYRYNLCPPKKQYTLYNKLGDIAVSHSFYDLQFKKGSVIKRNKADYFTQ